MEGDVGYYLAFLPIFSVLMCVGLGVFTLTRNPRRSVNRGFAFGMLCLAVVEAGSAFILFSSENHRLALAGARSSIVAESFLPLAWYLFSVSFARQGETKNIFSGKLPAITTMALCALFFSIYSFSQGFILLLQEQADSEFILIGSFGRYFYVFLIIGFSLSLMELERALRSSTGIARWSVKYIIFGTGGILFLYIYKASQAILFSMINIQVLPVISAVIIISTFMMAFFIVRYRLMDSDIFVSRYVVYNSVAVLSVGTYLLTVSMVAYGFRYFDLAFSYFLSSIFIFASILALVVAIFTESLRRQIQLFINRNFFKHKYEFRDKWMESIKKISPKRLEDEIKDTLLGMVGETMGAKRLKLWLYDPVYNDFYSSDSKGSGKSERMGKEHPFMGMVMEHDSPFIIDRSDGLEKEEEFVLCSPLIAGEELIGFLLQGRDFGGEEYRQDDFELLTALTTQAAVQIKNTRLANELMAAKEMDTFNKMSSFIMHDLKNLTNSLSLVSQNASENMSDPEFQKDAILAINSTVARMKGLIEKLSKAPEVLEPKREKSDLDDIINCAIEKVSPSVNDGIEITYKTIETMPAIYADPDAVEMVILNVVTNACEAMGGAGQVSVMPSLYNDRIDLEISDNGSGMSAEFIERSLFKPFRSTKTTGFGIGLYQCRAIMEAHGGKIGVQSRVGEGCTFTLTFPISSREKRRV